MDKPCYGYWNKTLVNTEFGACGYETLHEKAATCCWEGNLCMPHGICQYSNGPGTGFGYFLGGCTDSSFGDAACGSFRSKYNSSDIAYNYTTEHWYCCGDDCSNPAGTDPYYAPPPEYLYASASVGSSQMFYPIQAPVTAAHAVTYTSLTYDPTTSATSPSTVTIISDSTTQSTVTITQQSTPASVLRKSASILRTPAGVWAGLGLTTGIALVAMLVLVLIMSRYRRVAKELKLSRERLNIAWHDKDRTGLNTIVSPYTSSCQTQAAEMGAYEVAEMDVSRRAVELSSAPGVQR